MSEAGLKFVVAARDRRRIWDRVAASGLAVSARTVRIQRHIWFDTAGYALSKAGISLWLRRDGRRWVQVLAAGTPGEFENSVAGGGLDTGLIADDRLRKLVLRIARDAPLRPICEATSRSDSAVLTGESGTGFELVTDSCRFLASGQSASLHEAGLRLVSGNPGGLFDVAREFFADSGLKFSRLTQADRAFLLAETGSVEPPLALRKAVAVRFDAKSDLIAAAQKILRECLEQIATNMTVMQEQDNAEGPHQMRVGLRRLRTALSVVCRAIEDPDLTSLKQEARWLGAEVGRLRDLQVVAGEIVAPEALAHPEEPGLARLLTALLAAVAKQRRVLQALLGAPRAQACLLNLACGVETLGSPAGTEGASNPAGAMPVKGFALAVLENRWRNARKCAKGWDNLDSGQKHELRKQLKKLRYMAEFFAPLYPDRKVEPFLRHLRALQVVLGSINDAAVAQGALFAVPLAGKQAPAMQRAIGWVIGSGEAGAKAGWLAARPLWRDLRKTRPYWT